jgi:hypothetical protein
VWKEHQVNLQVSRSHFVAEKAGIRIFDVNFSDINSTSIFSDTKLESDVCIGIEARRCEDLQIGGAWHMRRGSGGIDPIVIGEESSYIQISNGNAGNAAHGAVVRLLGDAGLSNVDYVRVDAATIQMRDPGWGDAASTPLRIMDDQSIGTHNKVIVDGGLEKHLFVNVSTSSNATVLPAGTFPASMRVLSVQMRVATALTGFIGSTTRFIYFGTAATQNKYGVTGNSAVGTTIGVNVSGFYSGAPAVETAALQLTVGDVGAVMANVPSGGVVELRVVYLPLENLPAR